MSQLTITHADGTTGVYAVTDSSVLNFDGNSVALGGVTAIALSDAPAAPPEPATAEHVAITTASEAAVSSVTDTLGNTYAPAAVEPAPQKASAGIIARAVAFYRWTKSPMGRKDVALVLAAANAIYIAVHRAGF